MKRKVNWTRVLLALLLIGSILGVIRDYQQTRQIENLTKIVEKIDVPIEKRDGYYYDISEIPQELLGSEVTINE